MVFLVHCLYRPGGAEARLAIRHAHIEHMLAWLPHTVFGAAMLDDDGATARGMVVALDVACAEDARRFVAGEPYCRAGLFESIAVHPLVQMTPPYTPDVLLRELAAPR